MNAKLAVVLLGVSASLPASAHVKWFSKMANCMNAPITTLEIIALPLFWAIGAGAVAAMFVTAYADLRLSQGNNMATRWSARLNDHVAPLLAPLLRLGTAVYFLSVAFYFSESPIILTAELKTSAAWVSAMHLAIAATVLFRRGALLSALGIVVLYAYAASQYGLFHMLDYLFFLGLAAFLGLDARFGRQLHARALLILRVAVGVSLIWCGVEKWLFPAWTLELLQSDLNVLLTTGFSPDLIIMGAGFVEFCLAFLLIFGRIASQVAAAVLLTLMVSAIPLVGMVDLIGHLPILVVLVVLATTRNSIEGDTAEAGQSRNARRLGVSFMFAVPGFIGAYYLSHQIAYGVISELRWAELGIAALLVVLLSMRIVRAAPDNLRRLVRFDPA
jgi:hypothetical protein